MLYIRLYSINKISEICEKVSTFVNIVVLCYKTVIPLLCPRLNIKVAL